MPYNEQYAADVLSSLSQKAPEHTVILGAGANTRLALHRLGAAGVGPLQAILDDDPRRRGERVADSARLIRDLEQHDCRR